MKFTIRLSVIFVVLTLLVQCSYQRANQDLVTGLPDIEYQASLIYSGFLNANEKIKLHYTFVQSQSDPKNDPLILWLNGGPGCSGMLGMFEHHGPIVFDDQTRKPIINKHSWTKQASIIYLDSPAGVGFSEDYIETYNDDQTTNDSYNSLIEFFERFPNFISNKFYVGGVSYAGIYVPYLSLMILEQNEKKNQKINIGGMIIGNPFTDESIDFASIPDFTYEHGLYPFEVRKEFASSCFGAQTSNSKKCNFSKTEITTIISDYKRYEIYGNLDSDERSASESYLNRVDVKNALHVGLLKTWVPCDYNVNAKYHRGQSLSLYPKIIQSGIRILIYSGDTDSAVPFLGTQRWIQSLNLQIIEPHHSWSASKIKGEISGYAQVYKGLTLANIKGTGHIAPKTKRMEVYFMISKFLQDKSLTLSANMNAFRKKKRIFKIKSSVKRRSIHSTSLS